MKETPCLYSQRPHHGTVTFAHGTPAHGPLEADNGEGVAG
jgi:hypothetical protein